MDLSIIIPMYNAGPTIERTLRSLRQVSDCNRVQVILVDDGSTDDGASRAERALEEAGFANRAVLRQPNAGSSAARNRGLDAVTGKWVYFIDADDELAADPLALVDAAPQGCSAVLAASVVERDGRVVLRRRPPSLNRRNAYRVLSAANPLPVGGVMLRRDRIVRGFDVELRYLEDWQFWLDNAELFEGVNRRPDVTLARIHAHGRNKSSDPAAVGQARRLIAERWQLARRDVMSATERHNWALQRAIGSMLTGARPTWRLLFAWPCNVVLLGKFLVYAVMGKRLHRLDPYGARSPGDAARR